MPFKIYYIDDEPSLCSVLKDNLESPTVTVETFTDPDEAVRATQLRPPDLIFIDYRLGNMTGDQVADRIAAPIAKVLVTGDIRYKEHPQFIHVFFKPYDFDKMEAFIHDLMKQKATKRGD